MVALQLATGSGVLCLEIDESTEHAPQIRDKLGRYEAFLRSQSAWQLLFVVGSIERGHLCLGCAPGIGYGYPGLAGLAWAIVLGDLKVAGLGAPVVSFAPHGRRNTLRCQSCADPRPRTCPTPGLAATRGSSSWRSGGVEELDEALAW